ncbi:MAG TPA: hypothetical protein VGV59_18655 [Pyrinomonadaceae bacterium]|nr:hypothetical protein [Pyrinomonadaceae bacterium]
MNRVAFTLVGAALWALFCFHTAFGQTTTTVEATSEHVTVNDELTIFSDPRYEVNFKMKPLSDWLSDLTRENRNYLVPDPVIRVLSRQVSSHEEAADAVAKAADLLAYVASPMTTLLSTGFGMSQDAADLPFKRAAVKALLNIIEDGVPPLVEMLKREGNTSLRRSAARALKSIDFRLAANASGRREVRTKVLEAEALVSAALLEWNKQEAKLKEEEAKSRKQYLLRAYQGEDSDAREYAVLTLAEEYPEMADELVPELIKLVQKADGSSRQLRAIELLGELQLKAAPALKALAEAKTNPNKDVRKAASKALDKINKALKKSQSARTAQP